MRAPSESPRRPAHRLAPAVILGLVALAAGCVSPSTEGTTVQVLDNRFEPAALSIPAAEAITFVNDGALEHTVTIRAVSTGDLAFDRALRPGESLTVTLVSPGEYQLMCQYHASDWTTGMVGTVSVTPSGEG